MADVIAHSTVAAMLAAGASDETRHQTAGYYAPNDGGGGLYRFDQQSTATPDLGLVHATWLEEEPQSWTAGRWLLIHDGTVNVRQFGAKGDGNGVALSTQVGTGRFANETNLRAVYQALAGSPFCELTTSDTIDWAAIQQAVLSCLKAGIRLEGPSGIYKLTKGLWIGRDDTVAFFLDEDEEEWVFSQGVKDAEQTGFFFMGQPGLSRQETDNESFNLRLTEDRRGVYLVSVGAVPNGFTVKAEFGAKGTTDTLTDTTTIADFVTAIGAAVGTGFTVTSASRYSTGTTIGGKTVAFKVAPTGGFATKETYAGDFVTTPVTTTLGSAPASDRFAWVFPEAAIVSFRRSAGVHYVLENFTLKGADTGSSRFASFGVAHVNCAFTEHQFDRFYVSNVDTAYGILSGGAGNGELTQFNRLFGGNAWRAFYCNNPQSFQLNFTDWYLGLDVDGLFVDLALADAPGHGINLFSCHATFGGANQTEGNGTLLRVRRGTGIVQWVGGRIEHLATLMDYDAVAPQGLENNLDFVLRGVEIEGMVGGADRSFMKGVTVSGGTPTGTQYGLLADGCRFKPQFGLDNDEADLHFDTEAGDQVRCLFQNCRFDGIRAFVMNGFRADFVRCYRTDFNTPGDSGLTMRRFDSSAGEPGPVLQSRRNVSQDTPWSQTGPLFNALKNSDLKGQAQSTSVSNTVAFSVSGWSILGGLSSNVVFGKWGAFTEADFNPGPESFFLRTTLGQKVSAVLDFLDFSSAGVKVVTYQALVRVTGKTRFALVNSNVASIVYDELVLSPTGADTGWTLVTLRANVDNQDPEPPVVSHAKLEIEAQGSTSTLLVWWQQAWGGRAGDSTYPLDGGLANAGFARTPGGTVVKQTYPWAVNAMGVKAASRFQLPLLDTNPSTGDAKQMGWKSEQAASSYDLQSGELYVDDWQRAVMAFMANAWFALHQPERVRTNPSSPYDWEAGDEKNVVFDTTGAKTVNLPTSLADVAPGTTVRVHNVNSGVSTVTINMGSGSVTINALAFAECVFYDDGGTGRWLVRTGSANRKP
jgi:hypothetical protein